MRKYGRITKNISIHVPLAGDDSKSFRLSSCHTISIHVPLAGDDKLPVPSAVVE